ncbi:cation-translocating P-type ATPase [Mycolicibacter sp. MYC340]|uniref:Cation-translocating P-type ATPase n=1 Tax=[Mycobacterium] nativiensis TaxID=2855503 RepID=A0ABU5XTF9_9MYCO|nr:cation-translocating P-type ATPase [Mycolicibacter sp. MYC340]MEB3031276.1 cation-translocating P-type ATPase [Mycolicibacter sp. MYC340]
MRAANLGIQASSALVTASIQTAAGVAGAVWPAYDTGPALNRRCFRSPERAWVEVRGLDGATGDELATTVLAAARALPGVTSVRLNHPLSRLVVGLDAADPDVVSMRELLRVVTDIESQYRRVSPFPRNSTPTSLPGDGMTQMLRAFTVGANVAGLGLATAGRLLRLPSLPLGLEAGVTVVNYQPRLRALLEDNIGKQATDTLLSLASAAVHTLNTAPTSLAVDLSVEAMRAGEERAAERAWRRREPELAEYAEHPPVIAQRRPVPRPPGPIERHLDRASVVQAVGAGVIAAATRSPDLAGTAAAVMAPKATHTARESFASTLGRGLADQHGTVVLRPGSLRELDRVDTVIIDPRVLCGEKLRVMQVRGADDDELRATWAQAQSLLDDPGLKAGWHQIGPRAGVKASFQPALLPLATAVVTEARHADVEVVSVESETLGELRPIFDDIRPLDGASVDEALAAAVAAYQADGHDVAVLSTAAVEALAAADVALGMLPAQGSPPWCADVLLTDLTAVWRVLHALPVARSVSRRGIEIATGASTLGALLLLPGVRGRGPGPVTTGAAAGALSGYWMARRAVDATAPRPVATHEWHAMSVDQVRAVLPPPDLLVPTENPHGPAASAALAAVDLARRGAQTAPPRLFWQFAHAVRGELADPITPVLALGAAASAVLGSPVDAMLVGSVLGGNAMLAAAQRLVAERRLNVLLSEQVPPARKVLPDGGYCDVAAEDLRPGDVIEVRPHEVVPADGRLIEADDLEVDESSLTGESLSVVKQVEATPGAELAERECMVYAGTTVVTGTAIALVTAAGGDTHGRRAAELVAGEQSAVGLQHQLSLLTSKAWRISLAGGTLVTGLGMLRRIGLRQSVASGIAIAVAAIPEGLPLVATLAQQSSARRLAKSGVLVRIPRSVEALGRVDVVCFDKTGTLSQNKLRVTQVKPAQGYSADQVLTFAAQAAPTTNGRQVHATDAAIIEAAMAADVVDPDRGEVAHLPFRSGRSYSASIDGSVLTVKGAPEVVGPACGGDPEVRKTVLGMAGEGLRVIAVALRELSAEQLARLGDDPDPEDIAEFCGDGLTFVGLLGIADTPRAEAADLLAELDRRNIPVRLITGDHPVTATAIARELGLTIDAGQVITGADWDALSRKGQERAVDERVVFARMSPENKVQVVQTLERTGKVSAMVGDGANDAAAIRAATVGLAVVAHGSESASTAADVVLLDGRVHALLDALDEGHELWQRVQAAVAVLLGGNAGEVAFAIIGSAITGRSPLNARQLLLVNMLTDALPATALAVSSLSEEAAAAGGRGPDERALWRTVAVRGVTTASAAVGAWALASVTGRQQRASTVALVSLVATQLGQTLLDSRDPVVVATAVGSLGVMGTLITIPGVSQLLGCTPLGPLGWTQALGTATVATIGAAVVPRLLSAPGDEAPPTEFIVPGPRRPDGAPAPEDHPAPVLRLVHNGDTGSRRGKTVAQPSGDPSPPGGS